MHFTRKLCLLIIPLSLALPTLAAQRVILKDGYEVFGDVLKADEQVVIVDIGAAVLRLPQAQVARIVRDEPNDLDAPLNDTAENTPQRTWQIYRTAQRSPTTIERNVERFGEAVVMVTSPGGQGSGFLVSPDGFLITNYHVIARETRIKVTVFERTPTGFEQKHYKKVRIVALNPFVDLALLKIEEDDKTFNYAYLGHMNALETGQQVFAIGNPLGLTRTVSQGIISTTNRNMDGRLYIQTTTDINPGNSGGPLFNLRGEVIGVTSRGYLYLGGLNFAIPVDVVKRFIKNRDAFAYDEDNPNMGFRYLQPGPRTNRDAPPPARVPAQPAA